MNRLTDLSKKTGIPRRELHRLCLEAGTELLENGELVITPKQNHQFVPVPEEAKTGEGEA